MKVCMCKKRERERGGGGGREEGGRERGRESLHKGTLGPQSPGESLRS